MAILNVQKTGNTAAAGVATSAKAYASSNTASNLLVAAIDVYDAAAVPSIADSLKNIWDLAVIFSNTPQSSTISIFYARNCKAGANTVTGTMGSTAGGELHISEFSGADTYNPLVQTATGAGASGIPTTSAVTPPRNGCLFWGVMGDALSDSNIGTGWTLVATEGLDSSEYLIQTTAASLSAVWTSSAGTWMAASAVFSPAFTSIKRRLPLLGAGV